MLEYMENNIAMDLTMIMKKQVMTNTNKLNLLNYCLFDIFH